MFDVFVTILKNRITYYRLGASHDGDPSMQSEGLLGGAECPAQYGYIMSPLVSDRNQNLFSACSQRSISYNLK